MADYKNKRDFLSKICLLRMLGISLETIYRGIIPFVVLYLVVLALIIYFPAISLVGVRLLFN
jgi:C4-dicarboxylate transporter DctM subunit